MLLLFILLVILLIGSVPAWGYSREWGYYPSGTIGLILIILIILLALGQFFGADPRGAGFVLDDFGKGLARHVDAAIDRIPGLLPGRDPAGEHRSIAIAALD